MEKIFDAKEIEKSLRYEESPSGGWYCLLEPDGNGWHPLSGVLGRGSTRDQAFADFFRRAALDGHQFKQ